MPVGRAKKLRCVKTCLRRASEEMSGSGGRLSLLMFGLQTTPAQRHDRRTEAGAQRRTPGSYAYGCRPSLVRPRCVQRDQLAAQDWGFTMKNVRAGGGKGELSLGLNRRSDVHLHGRGGQGQPRAEDGGQRTLYNLAAWLACVHNEAQLEHFELRGICTRPVQTRCEDIGGPELLVRLCDLAAGEWPREEPSLFARRLVGMSGRQNKKTLRDCQRAQRTGTQEFSQLPPRFTVQSKKGNRVCTVLGPRGPFSAHNQSDQSWLST